MTLRHAIAQTRFAFNEVYFHIRAFAAAELTTRVTLYFFIWLRGTVGLADAGFGFHFLLYLSMRHTPLVMNWLSSTTMSGSPDANGAMWSS